MFRALIDAHTRDETCTTAANHGCCDWRSNEPREQHSWFARHTERYRAAAIFAHHFAPVRPRPPGDPIAAGFAEWTRLDVAPGNDSPIVAHTVLASVATNFAKPARGLRSPRADEPVV